MIFSCYINFFILQIRVPILIFLINIILFPCLVHGQSAQWRGPSRNGVFPDTALLEKWPESGPEKIFVASGIGKGYSSLASLKDFPIDTLKIDRSFLLAKEANDKSRSIIEAAISIGHSLSMTVITEGIESQEHVDFLLASGCEAGQGYFLGRPIPAEQMEILLRESEQCSAVALQRQVNQSFIF